MLIVFVLSVACSPQDAPKKAVDQSQFPLALWDTGNQFLATCADVPDRSIQTAECVAYVMGVWDGFVFGEVRHSLCVNDYATPLQLKRITVNYIAAHPEKAHKASVLLVTDALKEAFPCPTKEPK